MSKTTTEMQLISIDKLVPYVNNARTHSAEQILKLRSSLREFGFVNPIIIDREFNVIAGHGRLMAAKEEGIEEVPCVFVDYLTDAQKKAYILADNRMAMDAGWDDELLKIEMEELQNLGYDLEFTGFDEKELADLFGVDDKEVKEDEFDLTAALEKASFVERGDVWFVGKHRLMCGDATSSEDVAKLSKAPGVGKKTAERIVLELKDKVDKNNVEFEPTLLSSEPILVSKDEAVDALVALGYSLQEAKEAVDKCKKDGLNTEDIIKKSLTYIMSKSLR